MNIDMGQRKKENCFRPSYMDYKIVSNYLSTRMNHIELEKLKNKYLDKVPNKSANCLID